MEGEALYKLRYGGLEGKQYTEAMQEYLDIPEKKARAEEAYTQGREVSQLQRQAAPFEEMLKMLQRLSISETITPERKEEVIAVRDAIANSINDFGRIMTQDEKLKSLKISKDMFSPKEYEEAVKLVKEGGPEQYKGLTPDSLKGLYSTFNSEFQKMTQATSDGYKDLGAVFGQNIGDITRKQDEQTNILNQIAKIGFGFKPKDIGEEPNVDIELPASKLFRTINDFFMGRGKLGQIISGGTMVKAMGGRIFGEGGPREDKVPAMLSPGEYVVKAASAQRLGYGTLEHINQKGAVPGFAEGGRAQRFKIDQQFGTIDYDYKKDEDLNKLKNIKEEEKKSGALKSISDNVKKRKEYEKALGAGGGAVETLRAIGMSEEDIKRELGGLEEPLIEPADILGLGFGATKLALGLGKGVIKQIAKKPKIYEELLSTVQSVKSPSAGTKDVINFIKNRLAEPGDLVAESKAARDTLRAGRADFLRRQGLLPSNKKLFNPKKKQNKMMKELGLAGGGIAGNFNVTDEYDEIIKEAAKGHNLDPSLLKAVMQIESGGKPNVVSKVGAQGLMQFMLPTAARYELDDPFDPEESINAAARYFADLSEMFGGNIELMLSGYNAGENRTKRIYDKYKRTPNIPETQGYLKKYESIMGGFGESKKLEEKKDGLDSWHKVQKKRKEEAAQFKKRESIMQEPIVVPKGTFLPPEVAKRAIERAREAELSGKGTRYFYADFDKAPEELSKGLAKEYGMSTGEKRPARDLEKEREWEKEQSAALEKRAKKTKASLASGVYDTGPVPEPFVKSTVINKAKIKTLTYKTDKEEKERLAGFGSPLPGREAAKKVQDIFQRDALAEAKQRVVEAEADKFVPKINETKRVALGKTPGKQSAVVFGGYKIPKKIEKAGENQLYGGTIKVGHKEGKDLHTLRQMQEKLKFVVGNKENVYKLKNYNEEQKEQYEKYIKSQIEESNRIVSKMQSGQSLGATRAWDPEYKRSYFPEVEKYHKLKEDFTDVDIIYNTLKNKQALEKYKGFEKLNILPSDSHKKILTLINKGKKEEAKKVYEETLKERKSYGGVLSKQFDEMAVGLRTKRRPDDELSKLELLTEASRINLNTKLTGNTGKGSTIDLLRTIFPDAKTDEEILRLLKSMSQDDINKRVEKHKDPTGEVKHHGGEIRKTGHVFMQKGEMVYPKAFAEGGPVYGELANDSVYGGLANETTTQPLNNSMEVKINIDEAINRLAKLELKVEDKKLEVVELPKLEINTDNVNLTVDGDAAAAKIQTAVENIKVNTASTGSVGAEELKNVSEQLESRINSLNVNVEDLQNDFKMISSAGENIDINGLLNNKINEYTSDINRDISEVKSNMSNLESRITQNQNMINVTTTELDRKIMHLQNLTGRGNV